MASSSAATLSSSGSRDYPPFSYVVDAIDTPDVLFRKNLRPASRSSTACTIPAMRCSDRKTDLRPGTPHPTGMPERFPGPDHPGETDRDREPAAGPSVAAGRRHHDRGNNCIAYADLKAPDGFGTATSTARSPRRACSTTIQSRQVRRPTPTTCRTASSGCSST